MKTKAFYGEPFPGVSVDELKAGTLIVIEGTDGSGRSTQISIMRDWLEQKGHAVVEVGLKRSDWIGVELEQATEGNILNPITLSLFYATDFMDQFETKILPAMRAGFIVLADRYIYSLIARAIVRDLDAEWIREVYQLTLKPDAVFYLECDPKELAMRNFRNHETLDYWEAGMDIQHSDNMYISFVEYQTRLQQVFRELQNDYGFEILDANGPPENVARQLKSRIQQILSVSGDQS